MGCGASQQPGLFKDVYTTYPQLNAYRPQFESLKLYSPEIGDLHIHISSLFRLIICILGKLYNLYRRVDADDSGEISYEELLVHIDIGKTPFSKRIFTIFDEDGSGQISFPEFVLTLW